jgi:glutaredoxin
MTTRILDDKGVQYEYKILEDFASEEQDKFLQMAQNVGQLSMPIIIKDNKVITLQEID